LLNRTDLPNEPGEENKTSWLVGWDLAAALNLKPPRGPNRQATSVR